VNWQLRVWAKLESYWDVRERLTQGAKEALDNAGIGIPFPQMDVHMKNAA
jgi:small conductance mechanosensitive channel